MVQVSMITAIPKQNENIPLGPNKQKKISSKHICMDLSNIKVTKRAQLSSLIK